MEPKDIRALALRLNGDQTPRVWSLLVTVFGDLAQGEDDRISGKILRQLMDIIGVKPEAMRVALHRLRKEGWIDSEKQGRNSNYFLTPFGRAQSVAASPRIYASVARHSDAWLVINNPAASDKDPGERYLWITANTHISTHPPNDAESFATKLSQDVPLPEWMSAKLCDPETLTQSQTLAQELSLLLDRGGLAARLGPSDTAALRVLVVHSWRRIVLKVPELPGALLGRRWAGDLCRARVADVLRDLPKPALKDLENA